MSDELQLPDSLADVQQHYVQAYVNVVKKLHQQHLAQASFESMKQNLHLATATFDDLYSMGITTEAELYSVMENQPDLELAAAGVKASAGKSEFADFLYRDFRAASALREMRVD